MKKSWKILSKKQLHNKKVERNQRKPVIDNSGYLIALLKRGRM